ncbi:PrsW family glutamic-type intramembrane protease [Brasilonema sp. UFV-L1]|uniref:PrsW family glutamic-type intramembrane protease n=1 Tax=Brasilonema sp. UFV-L1 TaxID=2234130 RepID=UPI00145C5E90|nr:PrsW family glutamic-type intramembrane protease [Brasilonema sp. UFV-L1]NMG09398.1 PrsW family intramembrane metalloprotease [Brasilonema sp. UFV-L1]
MSHAFVRLVSGSGETSYSLLTTSEFVFGRDPSCQVVLKSNEYGMVSRHHATIRPSTTLEGSTNYVLCDLNSANGTYLNGHILQECQELHAGDRIILGTHGPEFVFEYQDNHQSLSKPQTTITPSQMAMSLNPTKFTNTDSEASWSQILPIFSKPKDFTRKAYLVPGIITVILVVLLFFAQGFLYQVLLGVYLTAAALYFVYQLCGKAKPWWVLVASTVLTIAILSSPILNLFFLVFRNILPGEVPLNTSDIAFPELFIRYFFGSGLLEELLKVLPVIGFYLLGKAFASPVRERIGVREPLDGILIGSASAAGFTLFETLGQYVPGIIAQVAQRMGSDAGWRAGLELLIPRILGDLAGHMAWSGWFGYCIGLSVLKPRQAWRILALGYLSAAGLHGLWNSITGLSKTIGIFVVLLLMVVGGISYALLGAAIVKARALSPTRSQNFATRFTRIKN